MNACAELLYEMLTVLIEAGAEPSALGATLSTLIPGAIEGIVREVVVIDRAAAPAIRKVADHAGCRLVTEGDLAGIVASARGEWILLLEPGARLSTDWIEAVVGHLSEVEEGRRTPQAARFTQARQSWAGFLPRLMRRPNILSQGLLLTRHQAFGAARTSKSLEEMGRGLATTRLHALIRPRAAPR